MSRNLYLFGVFFCLLFSIGNAQRKLTRIVFEDGTSIDGFARFINYGEEIKFWEEEGADPKIYSFIGIDKIMMFAEGKRLTFEYIQVINQGTYKLAELLKEGKVNLYRFSYKREGWTLSLPYIPAAGPSFPIMGSDLALSVGFLMPITTTDKDFCVKREDEEMARYFKDASIGASFKQLGAYYFQDCPELSKKIKSGKLKLGKLRQIVDYYNNFCE